MLAKKLLTASLPIAVFTAAAESSAQEFRSIDIDAYMRSLQGTESIDPNYRVVAKPLDASSRPIRPVLRSSPYAAIAEVSFVAELLRQMEVLPSNGTHAQRPSAINANLSGEERTLFLVEKLNDEPFQAVHLTFHARGSEEQLRLTVSTQSDSVFGTYYSHDADFRIVPRDGETQHIYLVTDTSVLLAACRT